MSEERNFVAPHPAVTDGVVAELKTLLGQLFGINPSEIAPGVSLVEMGADSLFLLQVSQAIRDRFGVRLPFRMMLEEYSTVEALAGYIAQNSSAETTSADTNNTAIAETKADEVNVNVPRTLPPALNGASFKNAAIW